MLFVTLVSLLVHSILLFSSLDMQLKSRDTLPENDLKAQFHPLRPPSNRIALFVVEDRAANEIYSLGDEELPFIRRIITKRGRWGIAYFNSTVDKNSAYKPLPFITGTYKSATSEDTVFKSANKVWAWCNPHHTCLNNYAIANSTMFNSPLEASPSINWMSVHVENLFLVKGNEETINEELAQDRTIFYFSFGSADLSSVDAAMRNISSFFESYYGDKKTTFVFTASVTREQSIGAIPLALPFISWGAGIKNPRSKHSSTLTIHDEWSEVWGLERLERLDLDQTDIAPLLSVLIGTRIPLHSLGVLPVSYVHYNKEFFAEASYSNALQLLEIVTAKEKALHSKSLPFFFRPYSKLTHDIKEERKKTITSYIQKRKLQEALDLSMELMLLSKEAIHYYDTYHQFSIRIAMAVLLSGWILCLIEVLVKEKQTCDVATDSSKSKLFSVIVIIFVTFCLISMLVWYQGMPPHFFLYLYLPLLLWFGAISNRKCLYQAVEESSRAPLQFYKNNLIILGSIFGMELVIFSFTDKSYLLSLLWTLLSLWPFLIKRGKSKWQSSLYWSIACIAMAGYVSISSSPVGLLGSISNTAVGLLVFIMILCFLLKPSISYSLMHPSSSLFSSKIALWLQLLLLLPALLISNSTVNQYMDMQYVSWGIVLLSALLLPGLSRSVYGCLLQLGLFAFTVLVIFSDMTIFFVVLSFLLYSWLVVEDALCTKENKVACLWDGVVAYSFIETPVLIPRNETSRTEYVVTFRQAMIACAMLVIALQHFDSSDLLNMPQNELLSFSFQFLLVIIVISCCYNVLGSLAQSTLLANSILLIISIDLMVLHFLFFIEGTTSSDIHLINFYISVALAMILPLLLLVAQALTGRAVMPRKPGEHVN